jgi:hypothetical protein
MLLSKYRTLQVTTALMLPLLLAAQEPVDLSAINRIKSEAFQNSKVMDHMFYLTDVNGHRLTGSPGYLRSAEWAKKRLEEYGIKARLEKWGPFGRGWDYTKFEAHMIEPVYSPLIGFPLAWTSGTNGKITGEPMMAVLRSDADLEKFKGQLKGKIILSQPARDLAMITRPLGERYSAADLEKEAMAPDLNADPMARFRAMAGPNQDPTQMMASAIVGFRNKLTKFLAEEQPAVILQPGMRGDGGTIFGSSGGSRDVKDPKAPPTVALTPEHYNRIVRLVEKKIPVKLEIEVQAQFFEDNLDSVNVIGEIEGGAKKDEVVMIGAHLDSWHGGTGATDNAAGSAVMIEAMRILKALNLKLDRTVKIGLWGGEEQGLLGSRAWVKENLADRATMKLTANHPKFSAYYNFDNGTGKIRGIYLQGNDMARPIFESWLKPFADLGATTVTIRNTGGTDHLAFDAVGLPGFQFIQDPIEYETRTHHSNMDVYDRIQRGDLMQSAAIIAALVYHTANRPELLPRKPLPKPQPERRPGETPAPPSGN